MNDNGPLRSAAPRCRHDRILFDVEDGGVLVHCAISRAAIEEMAQRRLNLPAHLLEQFVRMQRRITEAAIRKSRGRAAGAGLLCIWSGDLDDDPSPVAPAAAIAACR